MALLAFVGRGGGGTAKQTEPGSAKDYAATVAFNGYHDGGDSLNLNRVSPSVLPVLTQEGSLFV